MKQFVGALAATLLLASAPAQGQTLGEAYVDARKVFEVVDPEVIVEDLDGEWLQLSRLAGADASAEDVDENTSFCGDHHPAKVVIETRLEGFTVHEVSRDRELRVTFSWIGGSRFVRNLDPHQFYNWMGQVGDYGDARTRATLLSHVPQQVDIYRPDSSILVIVGNGSANIYGRCP